MWWKTTCAVQHSAECTACQGQRYILIFFCSLILFNSHIDWAWFNVSPNTVMIAALVQNKYLLRLIKSWPLSVHFCPCISKTKRYGPFSRGMPHLLWVGVMGGKGGGIGPHNSIQPRAPKNFNPALLVSVHVSSCHWQRALSVEL